MSWTEIRIHHGHKRRQSAAEAAFLLVDDDCSAASGATATRLFLGGVRLRVRLGTAHGRSSDSQATYLLPLPSPWLNQCVVRAFVPVTAAGQSRILTGFPFDSPLGETMERLLYLGYGADASPFLVDSLQKPVQ